MRFEVFPDKLPAWFQQQSAVVKLEFPFFPVDNLIPGSAGYQGSIKLGRKAEQLINLFIPRWIKRQGCFRPDQQIGPAFAKEAHAQVNIFGKGLLLKFR